MFTEEIHIGKTTKISEVDDEESFSCFIEALGNLMTPEEYAKTSDAKISRNTAKYEKQRDEEIRKAVADLSNIKR